MSSAQHLAHVVRHERGQEQMRSVTVADAVEMTKLADRDYFSGGDSAGKVALFSPTGRYFVVVLRKGNVEDNINEFTILLWASDGITTVQKPKKLVTMSSSSNREAIDEMVWLDEETLAFLGEQPNEVRQVYTLNVRSRKLSRITESHTSVLGYQFFGNTHDHLAFTAEEPIHPLFQQKERREGLVVSQGQFLPHLIMGVRGGWFFGTDQLWVQRLSSRSRAIRVQLASSDRLSPICKTPFVSPSGRQAVIAVQTEGIPAQWKHYSDPALQELLNVNLRHGQYSPLSRYVIVDLGSGRSFPILSSPTASDGCNALWSKNETSVVLSKTYLPLDNVTGSDSEAWQNQPFTAEVDLPTHHIHEITSENVKLVGWARREKAILVDSPPDASTGARKRIVYERTKDGWIKARAMNSASMVDIVMRENMNSPPKIFAVWAGGHRELMLWDLNPQFRHLKFARVEAIKWKCSDGHVVNGGLYYPPDFSRAVRYPLVIQTHQWNPNRFWIDGPWTTAFAAQPLAAKNIMVLQMDESYSDVNSPAEVDREVSSIEGAIDYLDERSLIDRTRVGLLGFSRSCLFVKYALAFSRYQFAAASLTDGVDGGYFQYIQNVNFEANWVRSPEGLYKDEVPFGDGLEKWKQRSPGFNLDKVRAPVLITAVNPAAALFEWEWFAGLSRLGTGVEMRVLADGDHVLQRPWDRMASQQSTLDWFDFWLKGEEDPSRSKSAQYLRWCDMPIKNNQSSVTASACGVHRGN